MTDFAVIGGGIAGVAAAAHLASHGSVTLFEMESSLAYHTTGRSAALFVVNYGGEGSRPLAQASRRFLESPPEGSTDGSLRLFERWAGRKHLVQNSVNRSFSAVNGKYARHWNKDALPSRKK